MNDDSTTAESERIATEIQEARLTYGAILVGDQLNVVECVDETAFEDGSADTPLYTAFNNIGATLVPTVTEAEDDIDEELPVTATPYRKDSFETPRLTDPDHVASLLSDARAYYFLLQTEHGEWKRIENTVPERFEDEDELSDPFLGRYAVASTLVDEAGDRFAELPDGVEPENIELIDWTG